VDGDPGDLITHSTAGKTVQPSPTSGNNLTFHCLRSFHKSLRRARSLPARIRPPPPRAAPLPAENAGIGLAGTTGFSTANRYQTDAFIEDLGCDSLDVVEISMELEEHFDISIPNEFGDSAKTVGDAVDGIMRLLGEACRDCQ
jgi:acyl carrier protein